MRTRLWVVLLVPTLAAAQSRDQEIRLARSAAPPAISKDAKVYVLDHDHFVVADPGRSGEACLVARPTAETLAPMCGDVEADATILAVERFRSVESIGGKSHDTIKAQIAGGFKSGRFHAPKRPALIFMMSSAQNLADPDGNPVGKWFPHVMVFYPHMQNADYGLVASKDPEMPGVIEAGSPMSALIVMMHDWVDPATTTQ
jgi:hypothetical protein